MRCRCSPWPRQRLGLTAPCRGESSPGKLEGCRTVALPLHQESAPMCQLTLPEPIAPFVATLAALVDARQADLLQPLFQGILFAHGRRTATAWFRAGDCADDFRRGYHLLGTVGRGRVD